MTTDTTFTLAQEDDYQAIADIYNEYIRQGGQTMEEKIHNAEDIASWINAFNEREQLLVLKRDDYVLGWGIIKKYSMRKGYRFACETAIYLRSDELRKGYGSYMKRELIEICKSLNYHHLVAKIFATNEASINYNLKLGYEMVGRQKEIGFKNGQWMDVVIMQYIIR
jgi:L-amino acid N-acyltransferase YncA